MFFLNALCKQQSCNLAFKNYIHNRDQNGDESEVHAKNDPAATRAEDTVLAHFISDFL